MLQSTVALRTVAKIETRTRSALGGWLSSAMLTLPHKRRACAKLVSCIAYVSHVLVVAVMRHAAMTLHMLLAVHTHGFVRTS